MDWFFGRDAGIRTRDPLNPIQVRYQTAPRPDRKRRFEQVSSAESNRAARVGIPEHSCQKSGRLVNWASNPIPVVPEIVVVLPVS